MAVLTQTDRPKSVPNCFIIEVFGSILCCQVGCLIFSEGVGAFIIGFLSFFSYIQSDSSDVKQAILLN